jgi:hypothetical protein
MYYFKLIFKKIIYLSPRNHDLACGKTTILHHQGRSDHGPEVELEAWRTCLRTVVFADDCALLFNSRDDLKLISIIISASSALHAHRARRRTRGI